jgi:hypothetical protein
MERPIKGIQSFQIVIEIIDDIKLFVYAYALILSCIEGIKLTKKVARLRKTRYLRRVWGIKDKETVVLVCSELENPEREQYVDGEFIYNRKYGDLDAYIEVVYTLLRLYPNLKLKILSCGEAAKIKVPYDKTLILIGGPDYNSTTADFLDKSQFKYMSPETDEASVNYPNNIVLYHKVSQKEFCECDERRDYGYFERLANPHNPKTYVILIGGCHTVGVTAAIKAFSLVPNEQGEVNNHVSTNSRKVARMISKKVAFAVLIKAEKSNQTIHTPNVVEEMVFVVDAKCGNI